MSTYPKDPTNAAEALQTLAAFACQAPGRLPSRVAAAIVIANTEAVTPEAAEAFAKAYGLDKAGFARARASAERVIRARSEDPRRVLADAVEPTGKRCLYCRFSACPGAEVGVPCPIQENLERAAADDAAAAADPGGGCPPRCGCGFCALLPDEKCQAAAEAPKARSFVDRVFAWRDSRKALQVGDRIRDYLPRMGAPRIDPVVLDTIGVMLGLPGAEGALAYTLGQRGAQLGAEFAARQAKANADAATGPTAMHVFRIGPDTVVARDADDAWLVWSEHHGERREDYARELEAEPVADDKPITIVDDDAGPQDECPARCGTWCVDDLQHPTDRTGHHRRCSATRTTRTAAEWAASGRGFLCSTEY